MLIFSFYLHACAYKWMAIPDMGYVIANQYNVIVVSLSLKQSITIFSPRTQPPNYLSHIELLQQGMSIEIIFFRYTTIRNYEFVFNYVVNYSLIYIFISYCRLSQKKVVRFHQQTYSGLRIALQSPKLGCHITLVGCKFLRG